jgi:hypothetical protein
MNDDKNDNKNLTVISHNTPIVDNNKRANCNHTRYGMFYMCDSHKIDYHLHCICCGKILVDDLILRYAAASSKIFGYRYGCEKLYDHLL